MHPGRFLCSIAEWLPRFTPSLLGERATGTFTISSVSSRLVLQRFAVDVFAFFHQHTSQWPFSHPLISEAISPVTSISSTWRPHSDLVANSMRRSLTYL